MAEIKIKGTSSGHVSLKAPPSPNVEFTLPAADGSSGQYLKTDGSATLSFGTVSGGVDVADAGNANSDYFLSMSTAASQTAGSLKSDAALLYNPANDELKVNGNSITSTIFRGSGGTGTLTNTNNSSTCAVITTDKIELKGNIKENIVMDSGKGIDFAAETPSGTGSANTLLDDYEEGTWTPTLEFSGNSVGITYASGGQQGDYTKVGRQVTVHAHFQLTSKGSSTGWARLKGLPFTVGVRGSGSLGYYDNFDSSIDGAMQFLATSTNDIVLQETSSVNASSLADTHFENATRFYFTMTYETAT